MPLKATLVLTGGSLLRENSPNSIEIDATPINLSRSGILLSLYLDVAWQTLKTNQEIDLHLEKGGDRQSMKGRVVHVEDDHRALGLEFIGPLKDISRFLMPSELQ